MTIKIITYNVRLATDFKIYPDVEVKIKQIITIIDFFMTYEYIICLQEITAEIHFYLVTLFEDYNYQFEKVDDILIAIPKQYTINKIYKINVTHIISTKIPADNESGKQTFIKRLLGYDYPRNDHPNETINYLRNNEYFAIMLTLISDDEKINVCCYRMPDMDQNPAIMMIHAETLINWARNITHDTPLIVAGDFNFTPNSDTYNMLTKNEYNVELFETYFPSRVNYKPQINETLIDSYELSLVNNKNNKNKSRNKNRIDYIFHDNRLIATECDTLEFGSLDVYPNKYNPSDHMPLFVTLKHV